MADNTFPKSPIDKLIEEVKNYELPKVERPDRTAPRSAAQSMRSSGLMPPENFQPIFEEASAEYGVPLNVLAALGQQESTYNPNAIGVKTKWGRAKGIMQYIDPTASSLGINPFDAKQSIHAAAKQMRERLDKGYSIEEAIMAHHGGDDRKQWGPKTRGYVQDVMGKAGKIGQGFMKNAGTSAPEFDLSSIQGELDAQEPGRYKVLSPEEVERYQRRESLISGEGQLQAAQDAVKPGAPTPLTIENQQRVTATPTSAPSPLTRENQIRVENGLTPVDTRPHQGFIEATGNALSNVPERFQQSIAGLIQMQGESLGQDRERYIAQRAQQYGITPGDMKLLAWAGNEGLIEPNTPVPDALEYVKRNIAPALNDDQLKQLSAAGIINPDEMIAFAKDWREETKKTMAEVRPEPGSAAYYGSAAIGSLAEMAPMLTAAIITRNPAIATSIMAGQVGGQSYAEAREKGLDVDKAQTYAALTTAAEAIPEALVLGRLLKPGAGAIKKILEGTVLEGAQEAVTAALQAGIDQQMIDPNMTLKEALIRVRDGAIVGTMIGGGIGGTVAGVDKMTGANDPAKQFARELNRSIDNTEFAGTEAEAIAALDPNRRTQGDPIEEPADQNPLAGMDTSGNGLIEPVPQEAPQPPKGALSRSAERVIQQSGEPVTVVAEDGELAGTLESYVDQGNGRWTARVVADDGNTYDFTHEDGVDIVRAGQAAPVEQAVEQAAEEVTAIEEDAPLAEQVEEAGPVVTKEVQEAAESAPVVAEAAPVEQVAEEAVEQAPEAKPVDQMAEPELRAELKTLAAQLKQDRTNTELKERRRAIEGAINALTEPKEEDSAPKLEPTSSLQGDPASWVIRNKETGEPVMETFDRKKVDALNTDKYEAVPIQQHLGELNQKIKAGEQATTNESLAVGQSVTIGKGRQSGTIAEVGDGFVKVKMGNRTEKMDLATYDRRIKAAGDQPASQVVSDQSPDATEMIKPKPISVDTFNRLRKFTDAPIKSVGGWQIVDASIPGMPSFTAMRKIKETNEAGGGYVSAESAGSFTDFESAEAWARENPAGKPSTAKPAAEEVKASRKPKQEAMPRQDFESKAGVGKISAVKERYSDKFGVSWASTDIATADTMEEAAAIAKAVAESGVDTIAGMRQAAKAVNAPKAGKPEDKPKIKGVAGKRDRVVTPAGREVDVEYRVVEAADLVTSNTDSGAVNSEYPKILQPRDRSRASSEMQINDIAANMKPRLLTEGPTTADGAPIVSEAGVVESGNGRTLAIKRAYARGMDSAQAYKQYLAEQGYDVADMQQPVLVRVRQGEMSEQELVDYTRESNERTTLSMSATERAMADAKGVLPIVADYQGGDLAAAANRDFVRSFVSDVVAKSDQAGMMDGNGVLSQEGRRRIEGALLAAAYGDPAMVAEVFESTDSDIKAIGGALLDAAGLWAQMRQGSQDQAIQDGLDITPNLMEAVNLIRRARAEGKKIFELVNQDDIFSGETHPITKNLMGVFYRGESYARARSREKVADALQSYARQALATQPGESLFGDALPPAQPIDLLEQANARNVREESQAGQQAGLFGGPQPAAERDGRTGSEGQGPRTSKAREAAAEPAEAVKTKGATAKADPLNQAFSDWVEAEWSAEKYKEAYLEDYGDEASAKYASVSGGNGTEAAAQQKYQQEILSAQRDASIDLGVYDQFEGRPDVQQALIRHFFDLEDRIRARERDRIEGLRSSPEEQAKKARIAEIDEEISRLKAEIDRTKAGTKADQQRQNKIARLEKNRRDLVKLPHGRMKGEPAEGVRFSVAPQAGFTAPAGAETGKPMRVHFARNTVSSKKNAPAGMDFGQKIEPAGEYMVIQDSDMSEQGGDGWQYGTVTFRNPLVLEHKSTNSTGWKKDLSEMFGGKTGKALANAVKKAGHDGIVTRDKYGYSETVNLAGDKGESPRFSVANSDPDKNLIAIHNLSAENLAFADRMGGISVPSIGVVTTEAGGVDGFGEITLIGTKSLGDPRQEPVFSADAYTVRFPRPEFRKAKAKDADAILKPLKPIAEEFGDKRVTDSFDAMVNQGDGSRAIDDWMSSPAAMAMFLREKGHDVKPAMRDTTLDSPFTPADILEMEELINKANRFAELDQNDAPEVVEAERLLDEAIDKKYAKRPALAGKVKERLMGQPGWAAFTLKGDLQKAKRGPDVDPWETRTKVRSLLEENNLELEFKQWVEGKILPVMGEPLLTVGRKKVPYTLDNIVDVMTRGPVRGQEKTMTFSSGQARAASSVEFSDVEQMRKSAAESIVDPKQYEEAKRVTEKLLDQYRDAAIEFTTLMNWKGRPDTFEALDASMRAIAKFSTKKKRDRAAMEAALKSEKFDVAAMKAAAGGGGATVDQSLIQSIEAEIQKWAGRLEKLEPGDSRIPEVERRLKLNQDALQEELAKAADRSPRDPIGLAMLAAEALLNAPVPYFEAKPQRAVSLNEFAGAVVPKNLPAEARAILEKNGIEIVEYEGDRMKAVREAANKLHEQRGDIRYSMQDGVPQAEFGPVIEAPLSVNEVRAAITKGMFGGVVDKMVEKGLIVIHSNSITLPKDMGRGKRGVQAVTEPDGKVHLVASNLTQQNANAVLLHEMFHSGVESLVGSKRWADLQRRLDGLYRQAEKSSGKAREIFDRARARVADAEAQGAVERRMEVEEFGAYAIEEYESMPSAFRKWVDDVVGAIKAYVFSRYGKQIGQVTPAQLRALAKDALITMALHRRGELFGPIAERFSVTDEYMAAVQAGDMKTAQRLVNEAAAAAGYIDTTEYRMSHTAPDSDSGTQLTGLKDAGLVPDDYWTHPQWYQTTPEEMEAFRSVSAALRRSEARKAAGKKPGMSALTVYRAVPKDVKDSEVRNGDWVTPSRAYAQLEGASIPGGYRIISQQAMLDKLWWDGNSIAEFGYDDGKNYAYRNTKNNRKLLDPVTYDDDGNVIPLKERFKARKDDARYSVGNSTVEQDVESLADFYSQDDDYQFDNFEEREAIIDRLVSRLEKNRGFTGMILPTGFGSVAITKSAKQEGAWQVTQFDSAMIPMSDNGIQTKEQALRDFFDEARPIATGPRFSVKPSEAFNDLNQAQKEFLDKIGPTRLPQRLRDRMQQLTDNLGLRIRQAGVDRYAALLRNDQALLGEDALEGSIASSAWVLARMSHAAGGAVSALMNTGRIYLDPQEKVIDVREGTSGLATTLRSLGSPAEIDRFMGWIAANRSSRLAAEGRENLFTKEQIEAGMKLSGGKLENGKSRSILYAKAWKELQQHRDDVLGIAEQAGLLKPALSKPAAGLVIAREYGAPEAVIKQLSGARNAIDSATTPDMLNTAEQKVDMAHDALLKWLEGAVQTIQMDALNTPQQKLDVINERLADMQKSQRELWSEEFYVPFYRVTDDENISGPSFGGGSGLSRQKAFEKLKGGKQNLNDLLENTLLNFHHLIQASLKNQAAAQAVTNAEQLGIASRTTEARRDKKASTWVMENGEKHWYDISDPLTFKALSALMTPGLNNPAMRIGRAFKRFFTNMTTVTPQFVIANTLRDTLSAMATSPTSMTPMANAIKGAITYGNDRNKARMMASGAAFSFGHVYGSNPDEIKASLTGSMRKAKVLRDPKLVPNTLLGAWRKWNQVTDFAENVNRAGIWERNLEKGKLKAAFEARDLMDFSAHGDAISVRVFTDLVPFLNARIQGLDKLYRAGFKTGAKTVAGKANKAERQAFARFMVVTGALTLASTLLYLANYDDEEYRKLEDWQRDTYWVFRFGDEMFFLPKPFEVGAIATMGERLAEQFVDPAVGGRKFAERLGHMLTDTFSLDLTPQAIKPAVEVFWKNKDSFTGRQIEDQSMNRLSPSLRSRPDTSRLADATSRGMEAATSALGGEDLALSPVQIDHLIRGYTGAVGSTAVATADTLWRRAMGEEMPARRWHEYQPIKRFYRDLTQEPNYTRYGTDFYEALKKVDRAYADLQHLEKYGDQKRAAEVAESKADELGMRKALEGVRRSLSRINADMKRIQLDKEMSGEAKRLELDRLRSMRNLITGEVGKDLEQERVRKRAFAD